MFGFFKDTKEVSASNWETLNTVEQLESIVQESMNQPVVVFKHSTRCSISSMAKSRLELNHSDQTPKIYYLDLIAHRDVSDAVASQWKVRHESPQVLILSKGKIVYHTSHGRINMEDLIRISAENN